MAMSGSTKNFFSQKKEWSIIKDNLLESYLLPYFQKVLCTGKPICYIDCFAGQGKFDDGKDGSPLIAIKTAIKSVKQSQIDDDQIQLQLVFIEPQYAHELENKIDGLKREYVDLGLNTHVYDKHFENSIYKIIKENENQNFFLYIDPFGIKQLNYSILENIMHLPYYTIEILLNFNSFGFFRVACRALDVKIKNKQILQDIEEDVLKIEPSKSEETLSIIMGTDQWKEIILEYRDDKIDGYLAEKKITNLFENQLRKQFKFVLDMPIRLKEGNRPKYRMIHMTNHSDGCMLMVANIMKRHSELILNVQHHGQVSLFDEDPYMQNAENEFYSEEDIKNRIEDSIRSYHRNVEVHYKDFAAKFYSENGLLCTLKQFQEYLTRFKAKGIIEIIREPAITKNGKDSTFWTETKGKKIFIKRKI